MKMIIISCVIALFAASFVPNDSFAHQSGCHRWHSCPSDTGSYVCGDLGYDTYCPKPAPKYEQPKYEPAKEKIPPKKTEPKDTTAKPKPEPACDGKGKCIVGIVQRVIDGDTLIIDKYTVRLSLANTPEKSQAGFREASAFTSKLCRVGSYAIFDQDIRQPMDKYGRVIGKVICDGKTLNSELVLAGHATILKQYCAKSEYSKEEWARKNGC